MMKAPEECTRQPSAVCPRCGWSQDYPAFDVFVEQGRTHEDAACIPWQCEACHETFLVTQVVEVTYTSSVPAASSDQPLDQEEYDWITSQSEPEGWAIFDSTEHGLQIQRDDDACVFLDDESVWRHLEARLRRGDQLAVRAFAYIARYNPGHLTDIQTHLRDWEQEED
jgi:hypothetical protein